MANYFTYTDAQLAQALRTQISETEDSHRRRRSAGTLEPGKSAGILERLRAGAARLESLAGLSPLQLQFLALVQQITPEAPALPAPVREPVVRISGEQFQRITTLLNASCITPTERGQGLLRIPKMDTAAADAYIAELEARMPAGPTARQQGEIQALLSRSCFTTAARAQGLKKAAELNEAGAALYLQELETLADDLEKELTTASTPAQAQQQPAASAETPCSHPALVASPHEQAQAAYKLALDSPRIEPEERATALDAMSDFTEAELRAKTCAVRQEIIRRQSLQLAAHAA